MSGIGRRQDDVEDADPVGGDHEQVVARVEHLADLAGRDAWQIEVRSVIAVLTVAAYPRGRTTDRRVKIGV